MGEHTVSHFPYQIAHKVRGNVCPNILIFSIFVIEELFWRRIPDVSIQKVSVSVVEVHWRPGTHGGKQINLVCSSAVRPGTSSLRSECCLYPHSSVESSSVPFHLSPAEKQLLLMTKCHLVEEAEESLVSKTVAHKSLLSSSCKCQST